MAIISELSDAPKQLTQFCRRFLQLDNILDYPGDHLLRDEAFQQTLYKELFKDGALQYAPPQKYRLHVLKKLTQKIEHSISDWEEHGISEDLVNTLSSLLLGSLPPEAGSAQQKSYVTYTLSLLPSLSKLPPSITLLEARNIVAASGTTGMRTWEAALHLGNFLSTVAKELIRSKAIMELGTGTGYVSVLCAKYLGASHVIATDGSEDVITNLLDNFALNGLQYSMIEAKKLEWGHFLLGEAQAAWHAGRKVDVVLGADITYDESAIQPLLATFDDLFLLFPDVTIIISATIRNSRTFEAFRTACEESQHRVEDIDFDILPAEEQTGPFCSDKVPIKLCLIKKQSLGGECQTFDGRTGS